MISNDDNDDDADDYYYDDNDVDDDKLDDKNSSEALSDKLTRNFSPRWRIFFTFPSSASVSHFLALTTFWKRAYFSLDLNSGQLVL